MDAASGGSSTADGWAVMAGAYAVAAMRYLPPGMCPAVAPSVDPEASLLAPGWLLRFNFSHFAAQPGPLAPPPAPRAPPTATVGAPPTEPSAPSDVAAAFGSSPMDWAGLAASLGASATVLDPRSLASTTGVPLSLPHKIAAALLLARSSYLAPQPPAYTFARSALLQDVGFSDPGALLASLTDDRTGAAAAAGERVLPVDSAVSALGAVSSPTAVQANALPVGLVGWATTVLRASQLPPRIVVRVRTASHRESWGTAHVPPCQPPPTRQHVPPLTCNFAGAVPHVRAPGGRPRGGRRVGAGSRPGRDQRQHTPASAHVGVRGAAPGPAAARLLGVCRRGRLVVSAGAGMGRVQRGGAGRVPALCWRCAKP